MSANNGSGGRLQSIDYFEKWLNCHIQQSKLCVRYKQILSALGIGKSKTCVAEELLEECR